MHWGALTSLGCRAQNLASAAVAARAEFVGLAVTGAPPLMPAVELPTGPQATFPTAGIPVVIRMKWVPSVRIVYRSHAKRSFPRSLWKAICLPLGE